MKADSTDGTEVNIVEEKAVEESKEETELRELKEELKVKEIQLKNDLKRRGGGVFKLGPGQTADVPAIEIEIKHRQASLRMKEIELQYYNPLRPIYQFEDNDEWKRLKNMLDTEGQGGLNAIKETLQRVMDQKEAIDKEIPELEKSIPELKAKIESLTPKEVKDELVKEGQGEREGKADGETEPESN